MPSCPPPSLALPPRRVSDSVRLAPPSGRSDPRKRLVMRPALALGARDGLIRNDKVTGAVAMTHPLPAATVAAPPRPSRCVHQRITRDAGTRVLPQVPAEPYVRGSAWVNRCPNEGVISGRWARTHLQREHNKQRIGFQQPYKEATHVATNAINLRNGDCRNQVHHNCRVSNN